MERSLAESLIDELTKHLGIINPDKDLFLNILTSAEVPESSKFYEVLPNKQQLVEERKRYHYLSLRKVLRNRNAKENQLSLWKSKYESIASAFGICSSDVLSRNLRVNKDLIEMMDECKEPFSLLGEFQTYNFDNHDETLFIITRPVLVIPSVENRKPYNWENANTKYEKEVGVIFRHSERIKPQEYFSR